MWDRPPAPTRQKQPNEIPLLAPQDDAVPASCNSLCAAAVKTLMSWLNRRRRRYILLILCSPLIVPLLCATCPIICAVELFFFILGRRRRKAADGGGERLVLPGGDGEGERLLQRYLDDQLMLVEAPPCAEEDGSLEEEEGVDVGCFDNWRTFLQ